MFDQQLAKKNVGFLQAYGTSQKKQRDAKLYLSSTKRVHHKSLFSTILPSVNIFMGQKVHPLAFRLGVSQEHSSHWFAKSQRYSQLVIEDHFLREYIYSKFPNAGIAAIYIERQLDTIQLNISSARPRQLLVSLNKKNELSRGITELRKQMRIQDRAYRNCLNAYPQTVENNFDEKSIGENTKDADSAQTLKESNTHTNRLAQIHINFTKVTDPDSSASCLAEFIVEQLERRVPFRRALKQAVQRAERASVKGIKVQISGRLNGAEIARSERIHKGQVPLHTLRAKMEYTFRKATTIYGLLGVKVWVFKGFVENLKAEEKEMTQKASQL